jgi:hypothetical protein
MRSEKKSVETRIALNAAKPAASRSSKWAHQKRKGDHSMRKTTLLALATTLALGFAPAAMAGEGSPDLARPSYSAHDSDPDGSNYVNEPGGRAFAPYAAPAQRTVRARRSDENTGSVIRQNRYDEQNGITGE